MTFPCVDDHPPGGACGGQHLGGRAEPGAGQAEVVTHRVDVAARPAEVDLPVDADEGGVRRAMTPSYGQAYGVESTVPVFIRRSP